MILGLIAFTFSYMNLKLENELLESSNSILREELAKEENVNMELTIELKNLSNEANRIRERQEVLSDELQALTLENSYVPRIEKIARMVEAEATGASLGAKVNVANVIFNRLRSPDFPNTVDEVLFSKGQFQPIEDGRYNSVKLTKESITAVYMAIFNGDTTNGATFFMLKSASNEDNVTWFEENLTFIFKDDLGHSFYK